MRHEYHASIRQLGGVLEELPAKIQPRRRGHGTTCRGGAKSNTLPGRQCTRWTGVSSTALGGFLEFSTWGTAVIQLVGFSGLGTESTCAGTTGRRPRQARCARSSAPWAMRAGRKPLRRWNAARQPENTLLASRRRVRHRGPRRRRRKRPKLARRRLIGRSHRAASDDRPPAARGPERFLARAPPSVAREIDLRNHAGAPRCAAAVLRVMCTGLGATSRAPRARSLRSAKPTGDDACRAACVILKSIFRRAKVASALPPPGLSFHRRVRGGAKG